jgi:hypothetical protein
VPQRELGERPAIAIKERRRQDEEVATMIGLDAGKRPLVVVRLLAQLDAGES